MTNQIQGPPNKYEFGLDFNYAVWTPGTILSLVNVPWNNDYRDIVRFASKAALNAYLTSLEPGGTRIEKVSYVKPNTPVRISMPINQAIKYNYLRASNPIQPIPGNDIVKDYYYFITDVQYIAPNTTEVTLQLDVWQTFGYDVTFGSCYVKKGHIGVANENKFDSFGRKYLTVPEGLDTGGDYQVRHNITWPVFTNAEIAPGSNHPDIRASIIVVSTVDLKGESGTVAAPKLPGPLASTIQGLPSGAGVYLFKTPNSFRAFTALMKNKPWITQGIVSITMIPDIRTYNIDYEKDVEPGTVDPIPLNISHGLGSRVLNLPGDIHWREVFDFNIDARYKHVKDKFYTFPYMAIEMTLWNGSPVVLKPELWNTPNISFLERISILPPNQRLQFFPRLYNSPDGAVINPLWNLSPGAIAAYHATMTPEQRVKFDKMIKDGGDDHGDYLDTFVQMANFPTLPLVNNMSISYLASNNSTIGQQRNSADWTQQRALAGNQNTYDQASQGLMTAQELTQHGIDADRSATQVGNVNMTQQGAVSAGAGVLGTLVTNPLGVLGAAVNNGANLINTGLQTSANDQQLAIRNATASANLQSQNRLGSFVRDTNKELGDWAARGDYGNEIRAINAKVQDSTMIQPSVSSQFGGDTMNIGQGTAELSLRWKFIDDSHVRSIGEFWLRYGYEVQAFITPPADLMAMDKFTYWQMAETYIKGANMPETMKQTIRGIFEKGVTVWADPGYIGNTDFATNAPKAGISY